MKLKKTFEEIKEEISFARQEAKEEAQSTCACVRSRGAYLKAYDENSQPLTESESIEVTSKKKLMTAITDLKNNGAVEFFIEGGYNGADSLVDMNDGDYYPWVSEWYIEVEINE